MSDRHGFYTVDGVKFETKIKALIYANDKKSRVKWNFNDEVFNQYDWSVEPQESLDELYDLRARQIRERYDYVILSYSGGSDSNNILESFIRQGLHIDEVVSIWPLSISEKYLDLSGNCFDPSNNAAEYKLNVVNRLEYIRNVAPKTKITVKDSSNLLLDYIRVQKDDDWIENRHDAVNITGLSNWNLCFYSDFRKTFDTHKSVCVLFGVEKPRLHIFQDSLFFHFLDKPPNNIHTKEMELLYPNVDVLLFYWDIDSAKMLIKQAHEMRKFFLRYPHMKGVWASDASNDVIGKRQELMKYIIYPTTWNKKYWQINKLWGDWNAEFDRWFITDYNNTVEYKKWQNTLKELVPKVNNNLMFLDNGNIQGFKGFGSQHYFIGKV